MSAWDITRKDLRLLLRDRRALSVLLAFPLIFITILGFSTGQLLGWRGQNQLLKIAVVDENRTPISDQLVSSLRARDGLKVDRFADRETAGQMIDAEEYDTLLIVGSRFHKQAEQLTLNALFHSPNSRLVAQLDRLDLTVTGRPGTDHLTNLIRQLVFADVTRTVARLTALQEGDSEPSIEDAFPDLPGSPQPTTPDSEGTHENRNIATGSESGIVYQKLVPSYTVMFVFFLVNVMGRSFIQERDLGTLKRLRMAPVPAHSLLLGKTIPFFLISIAQTVLLFLCGKLLFGMSWGPSPLFLLPVMACTSLAATSLGLLIATLVRTDSQVSAYANVVVITMAGISGCFLPREWLPDVMQQVSLVTPHAWSLIAYDQLLSTETPNLVIVAECSGVLIGFALLFFLLGCRRFEQLSAD